MIKLNSKTLKDKFFEYANNCIDEEFQVDSENEDAILKAIEIIETGKKGIFFVGNAGSGKTLILSIFQRILSARKQEKEEIGYIYPKQRFSMLNAIDLALELQNSKSPQFLIHKNNFQNIFLDDIGAEEKTFGMEHLKPYLYTRHKQWEQHGVITHLSGNINIQMMGQRYSPIIESRFADCCVEIKLGNKVDYKKRRGTTKLIGLPEVALTIIKPLLTAEKIKISTFEFLNDCIINPESIHGFINHIFDMLQKYNIAAFEQEDFDKFLERAENIYLLRKTSTDKSIRDIVKMKSKEENIDNLCRELALKEWIENCKKNNIILT